jgi:hypothetical protein
LVTQLLWAYAGQFIMVVEELWSPNHSQEGKGEGKRIEVQHAPSDLTHFYKALSPKVSIPTNSTKAWPPSHQHMGLWWKFKIQTKSLLLFILLNNVQLSKRRIAMSLPPIHFSTPHNFMNDCTYHVIIIVITI